MIYIQFMDRHNRFKRGLNRPYTARSYYAVGWATSLILWLAQRVPTAFAIIMDEKGRYLHVSPEDTCSRPNRASQKTCSHNKKKAKRASPLYFLLAVV